METFRSFRTNLFDYLSIFVIIDTTNHWKGWGPLGIKHKKHQGQQMEKHSEIQAFPLIFYITFLFTTVIFIIGMVITLQNRMKLHENLEMKANYVALSVQDNLSNMKSSAVFMGNLASIERVLSRRRPHWIALRMTNDVTPYSTLYHYESICLFFQPLPESL